MDFSSTPPPEPPDASPPGPELLGTRLRRLLDELDAGVAAVYRDLGLTGVRPRFAPVLRVLARSGPLTIRDLARAVGVTHSAASQTVAQLVSAGLAASAPGRDARQRIVSLTAEGTAVLPAVEREWAATAAAAAELEAELSFPLSRLLQEALAALSRRPMRERIGAAADREPPHAPGRPSSPGAPEEPGAPGGRQARAGGGSADGAGNT